MSEIKTRLNDATTFSFDAQRLGWTIEGKAQKILIKPIDRGFVVKVGCKTIAVTSADLLIKHLTEYLKDPAGMEKKFNDNKLKF